MNIEYGDIFLADLDPVKGNEQGGFRPVLIFQKTKFNSIFSTVFIIPITSNLKAKGYMLTYFLDKEKTLLSKDSICLLFQPRTISKIRLKQKIGSLGEEDMKKIKIEFNKLY